MGKLLKFLMCGTKRRAPKNYDKASETNNTKREEIGNFWDIGGFQVALDRYNDGYTTCEDIIKMMIERAKLEENYSKSLIEWKTNWTEFLKKESKEYGSTKDACQEMLDTAEKLAKAHSDIQFSLIDETKSPVAEIKSWISHNYSKAHIHFKIYKEFQEKFEYAEKQWSDYLDELKKAEKEYHVLVKESIKCDVDVKNAEKNPNLKEEKREILRQETEKIFTLQASKRAKYENLLNIPDELKNRYEDEMKKAFELTQVFEISRIELFKKIFQDFNLCFTNSQLYDGTVKENLFIGFLSKIESIDAKKDVKEWSTKYGADMQLDWEALSKFNAAS